MTVDDILKIVSLTQAEINLLSDKDGLYKNSDTGEVQYNGSSIGGGTPESIDIISLSSTDVSTTIIQASASVLGWDIENEKDSSFSHDNITNNSRIEVLSNGTYKISANIRVESASQRAQFATKILIDGVVQPQPYGSAYIRNSGNSSDFWTCVVNPPPLKLTAGQYIEIQIQTESQITTLVTGTFIGNQSSFSMINLQGTKGEKGDTGSGSSIIVQKEDVNIGTTTDTLNFEGQGVNSIIDEGSNKSTVNVQGYYSQKTSNTNGGVINAAYGSPLECVPTSGSLEITILKTGVYIINGKINIGTDLNKDNGVIELMYGVDTGSASGAAIGVGIYTQAQQAKKNKRNGIQGTWGNVSLNAGDKVHLFLSTLGDSTTWEEGEIFVCAWE